MPEQFNIANHYDVMEQLDRDVHDDTELARSEVELALQLAGQVPKRVFLPCFGTGRHIPHLLKAGVKRIVGVDLSPKCVNKAWTYLDKFIPVIDSQWGFIFKDPRVDLSVGDLRNWQTNEKFDAVILLGNSFGDLICEKELINFIHSLSFALAPDGVIIMDYIGTNYLDRCFSGQAITWDATLWEEEVEDIRTPRFDHGTNIMTIDISVVQKITHSRLWAGFYQKKIWDEKTVQQHFQKAGVEMRSIGQATRLNPYYSSHDGELGMIARSNWWTGKKIT